MPQSPDFNDFIQHLTNNARSSLAHADAMARTFGSPYIGTEHLLLGVLSQESSIAAKILEATGVTLERAKMALNLTPKPIVIKQGSKGLSETAKLTLKMSWDVAQEFNQDYCGTEHILFSILSQKNARATVLLKDMSVEVGVVVGELEQYLNRQQYESEESSVKNRQKRSKRTSAVDYFSTDLIDKAREGALDPVIGREQQIKRTVTILNRRNKNNPVLIGEPGVGKTAIVEGLAQRIAAEEVPEGLLEKRIVMLDLAGMIAGTKYRGEFEERLKRVMGELTNDKNTILFIDELHLLVGAGAAEGAIDAGNILKPALARGVIQVIGATTTDEYGRHIERDAALERRFQPVVVPETNDQETMAIMRGLKKHYEAHHAVEISDDVLQETVTLSSRYINDRFMPDKAIDLLDEASAMVRIERGKTPIKQRKVIRELKLVTSRMEDAVNGEDYERAAKYKARMNQLNQTLDSMREKRSSSSKITLTVDDLTQTISTMTGIPAQRVRKAEAKYLTNLEKHLAKHVIGQDEAISAVARAIRRSRSGIGHPSRPVGSFIFLGPTGVGKTELARILAQEYFASQDALVKIDMSEFSERHNVARLVGAPAGYVGYDDGGKLTDKIRRQPHSLVLFDEIEKAHPEIFNILLQVLEDGYLTDAKGRRVDFTNTIIIMTSNVGAERLQREAQLGFRLSKGADESLEDMHSENTAKVMEDLQNLMRPELLNRIDKMVVFRALTKPDAKRILELQLKELSERLAKRHLAITITARAKRTLLDEGYTAQNGVRPLRRVLQEKVEDPLAEGLLAESYVPGDVVKIHNNKNELTFKVVTE